jgi:hypothetical protein
MGGGVEKPDGGVPAFADNTVFIHHDATDRHFARGFGFRRQIQSAAHPLLVRVGLRGWHDGNLQLRIRAMAELEVRTEAEASDPFGKKIGILASVIAVFLAIVTIVSHRAHTDAVLMKSDANDKWSYYQSKRIKFHSLELGEDLVNVLGGKSDSAQKFLEKYAADKAKYAHDSDVAQADARKQDDEAAHVEAQALRYDFGEGLLEIGLVLTSLYFISRSKIFPVMGALSAALGIGIAISGHLL